MLYFTAGHFNLRVPFTARLLGLPDTIAGSGEPG